MKKIRYYLFTIRWLWDNRTWHSSRQKWKALERAQNLYMLAHRRPL